MVNPSVQSKKPVKGPDKRIPALKRVRSDGVSTRSQILEAARRRLCEVGYGRLNVRDIAADAGVNHALIGYHFQGKRQLVLAVLDDANKRLLERQTRMYRNEGSAGQKWQQACDFYDEDIASGYVRLMMELMAASFNDEALRREFLPRLLAWNRVIEDAVAGFVEQYELDLPISVQAITAWIVWFWIGVEASMTLGVPEEQGHQREALEAVATLLRRIEAPARRATLKSRRRT
jgi:AcrR family transcriptional regulator